jgi:hypothetical protein
MSDVHPDHSPAGRAPHPDNLAPMNGPERALRTEDERIDEALEDPFPARAPLPAKHIT